MMLVGYYWGGKCFSLTMIYRTWCVDMMDRRCIVADRTTSGQPLVMSSAHTPHWMRGIQAHCV
jgi:hypothetical protein